VKGFGLAACLLLPSLAAGQGLIATRNHRAVSLTFYRWTPGNVGLESGESRWSVSWTEANDLRAAGSNLEDCEVSRLLLEFRRALPSGLEAGLELPLLARHGGVLDGVIDWWHRNVLGWTDPLRDASPQGRATIQGPDLGSFGSATGLGDVAFVVRRSSGPWRFGVALKLPTGDAGQLLGSGATDLAAAAERDWRLGERWTLHAYGAAVLQGRPTRLRGARDVAWQAGFGVVWSPNSRDQWIAQWQHEDSALRTGVAPLDAPHRLVTFGYRRLLGDGLVEAFFSEDRDLFNGSWPEGANVGPDFTVGLRYEAKVGR